MRIFETVVAVIPIVMCFQSLILDMAGNVGTQSLAVTIRVLVDENLTSKQKRHLVGKEMRVGFMNGLFQMCIRDRCNRRGCQSIYSWFPWNNLWWTPNQLCSSFS